MKYCNQCKINTTDKRNFCPLCQAPLIKENEIDMDTYPKIKIINSNYHIFFRILLLLSIIATISCVTVNLILPFDHLWCIFVIAGIVCMWITLLTAIKKSGNIVKAIFYQVIVICILAIIFDVMTKWHGWSIDYVIPIMCINAIVAMGTIAKILNYPIEEYIIYLIVDAFFGIIPIIFIIFNLVSTIYPSLICVITSILSLAVLLVFEGKSMTEELKRRFHL